MPYPPHDLSDTTFVIPFCLDLPERLTNLRIVTEYILDHFATRIVVSEFDSAPRLTLAGWPDALRGSIRHLFYENPSPHFRRARSVNLAAREVTTPYLAVYDPDVLLASGQYLEGISQLREGRCEMCLPYENRVMWIPRDDVPALGPRPGDGTLAALGYEVSDDSYAFLGLVSFLDTRAFRRVGGMNENFRSWGFEEMEFYVRLLKLGYRVARTRGLAYHLGHGKVGSTGPDHPHYEENQREYNRVLALDPDELRRYVASWPWLGEWADPERDVEAEPRLP